MDTDFDVEHYCCQSVVWVLSDRELILFGPDNVKHSIDAEPARLYSLRATLSETLRNTLQTTTRSKNALRGLFIGDALSMPVHWFYRSADIFKAFPPHGITQMQAAPDSHPGSIMSLHSQQRGGRSSVSKEPLPPVVGSVILRGRQGYWDRPGVHYHHGMPAGENTLNAWCARLMLQWIAAQRAYDADAWLAAYIEFMTADPPRHPDTYAESYHREFFANWQQGVDPARCGGITHDTPSMGALVTVAPLALALLRRRIGEIVAATEKVTTGKSVAAKEHGVVNAAEDALGEVQEICCRHVFLTHPDTQLSRVVAAYVALLYQLVWTDAPPQELFLEASKAAGGNGIVPADLTGKRGDAAIVGGRYSLACYITDSWPSVCYLAARYWASPQAGLVANTNLGGENAHRGAVLGTLLGTIVSDDHEYSHQDGNERQGADSSESESDSATAGFRSLFRQLRHHVALEGEITDWSNSVAN